MPFFKKRPHMSEAEELKMLRKETSALEAEYAQRQQLAALRKKVKEDRKNLKILKTELHPSIYRKFGKALLVAGKETAKGSKAAWEDYQKLSAQMKKEKVHVASRKKVLRQVS